MNFGKYKVTGAIANISMILRNPFIPKEVRVRLAASILHLELALEEWPTKLPDNWERL